jgi:hypothetical protein
MFKDLGQCGWHVCFGVIRVGLTAYRRLPLYLYKQTSSPCVGMSQTCHKQTSRDGIDYGASSSPPDRPVMLGCHSGLCGRD